MEELRRYTSIQELKENTKPVDVTSVRSAERHVRFENFMSFLKDDKDNTSSGDNTSMSRNSMNES